MTFLSNLPLKFKILLTWFSTEQNCNKKGLKPSQSFYPFEMELMTNVPWHLDSIHTVEPKRPLTASIMSEAENKEVGNLPPGVIKLL